MRFEKAILALLLATLPLNAGIIRLKSRVIDTATEPEAVTEVPHQRLNTASRHVIVEFNAPLTNVRIADLVAQGAVVTGALSTHAVMAAVPDDVDLRGIGVSWIGAQHPEDKISRELSRPDVRGNGDGRWNGWVVEFHRDVPRADAIRILKQTGVHLVSQSSRLSHHLVVAADPSVLDKLADWDEVAYIFPASDDLVGGREVMPCEGALVSGQSSPQYVTMSTGWAANTPAGVTLNYVFTKMTSQLPQDQVQAQIIQAMRNWSKVTNVQFAAGSDTAAPWTVAIEFGTTVNGDPTPFSSTNTLAHTYYPAPPNPEPIAGDLHFNPAVAWHIGASADIYTVALHELGHALGLGHTDNPSDVMYPYYQYGVSLSPSDIAGVVSLYGASIPTGVPAAGPSSLAPLVLAISSPIPGAETANAEVSFAGTLQGASGASSISWLSSAGLSGQVTGANVWSAGVPLAPGLNLITVTATDSALRSVSQLVRILRTGDGSSTAVIPATGTASIAMTSALPSASDTDPNFSASGTATDPLGVVQVTWETNSGARGIAVGTTNWTVSTIPLFSGRNVVLFREINVVGATHWTKITVQRQ